jgi:hypothetical protein
MQLVGYGLILPPPCEKERGQLCAQEWPIRLSVSRFHWGLVTGGTRFWGLTASGRLIMVLRFNLWAIYLPKMRVPFISPAQISLGQCLGRRCRIPSLRTDAVDDSSYG